MKACGSPSLNLRDLRRVLTPYWHLALHHATTAVSLHMRVLRF